jgi:hypothetical protein
MNDTQLIGLWSTLEPTSRRRARMETRIFDWIEASETSLVREWFALLKVEPLTGLAYATVGALPLLLFSPVGWVVSLVLG